MGSAQERGTRWIGQLLLLPRWPVLTLAYPQDVLPLLLAPSPALSLHAAHAISVLHSPSNPHFQSPGHAQLRALSYAVRWVVGIDKRDFMGPVLEGERWLVQAAGGVRPFLLLQLVCDPCPRLLLVPGPRQVEEAS